ncbi:MAG: exo-1,3-beta-glucanase [Alyxoria varia]|nr:MAG: exo-1,3-beta-glucanase [Alyxoria varia]
MKFPTFAALSFLPLLSEAAPFTLITRAGSKFDYSKTKVKGVNLGGWFVLEPWITPSLFQDFAENKAAVDEWTFCATLKGKAQERLNKHWRSWITRDDFNQIAKAGLNHVRIPIGYWSVAPVDGEPYKQGAYEVFGEALDWAQEAGLKVTIDLHGAPGSQNGFDNSGHYGSVGWTKGDTVKQTLKALKRLSDDHASHPAVASIELLNEPMGPELDRGTIEQFYRDGYGSVINDGISVVFHEAFEGVETWDGFGNGLDKLVLDTHHYEVFENELLQLSPDEHIQSVCEYGSKMAATNKPTITGEFTGGLTDCAKWLNGLGKGARYDGTYEGERIGSCDGKSTGTVAGLSKDDKSNIRQFIEAQLDAYEKAAGWVFWTWKNEAAPEWNMQDLLAQGLFPQPLTARKHPGQCGY